MPDADSSTSSLGDVLDRGLDDEELAAAVQKRLASNQSVSKIGEPRRTILKVSRPGPMRHCQVKSSSIIRHQYESAMHQRRVRLQSQNFSACRIAAKQVKARLRPEYQEPPSNKNVSIGSFLDIVDHSECSDFDGVVSKYKAGVKRMPRDEFKKQLQSSEESSVDIYDSREGASWRSLSC